jgi:hypothetical protein
MVLHNPDGVNGQAGGGWTLISGRQVDDAVLPFIFQAARQEQDQFLDRFSDGECVVCTGSREPR